MPIARTLTSLFACGLTVAGCRGEAPAPLVAELSGAAWLDDAARPVFDPRKAPRASVKDAPDGPISARLDGQALSIDATRRGGTTLVRIASPTPPAAGELCLTVGDRSRCWGVRFVEHPHRRPAIAALDALELPALVEKLGSLEGIDRLWGHQIHARHLARAGRYSEAVDAWRAAGVAAIDAGRPREAARALRAASFMAVESARYTEVEPLLDRALALLGDDATAEDRLLDLYYRAFVDYALSRYRSATDRLEEVAERAWLDGADGTFGAALDLLAVVLVDQGRIADAQAAIDDTRLAAQIDRRPAGDRAVFLSNRAWIGLMAISSGVEPPTAVDRLTADLERAIALAEGVREQRVARINLARAHLLSGHVDEARAAIAPVPIEGDPDAALMLGEVELEAGRTDTAREAFRRAAAAIEQAAQGIPTDNTWRAAYGLGRLAAAQGQRAAALEHFDEALDALDAVATRAGVWHARARFYADRRPLVDDTITLLLAEGDAARAFAVLDRSNARALRALEARTRLDRLPAAVRSEWEGHRARFAAARRAFDAARDEAALLGPEGKAAWQSRQDARQREMVTAFEAAEALLSKAAPTRAGHADAEAVSAALPPRTAVLALGRVGQAVHAFWLAAGRPIEHRTITGEATAEALVAPFGEALAGVEHLYVVPGDVPAARELSTAQRDGAPLGTRISLSDVAYAGLLLRPRATAHAPALVVADPTIDLPHAYAEGRAVARNLPDARLLTRGQATREAVRAAMAGARVFHYAGHGVARAGSPWHAHLALAGDTTLTVADIITADVPAGTVVLSGCRTGVRGALSDREALGLADAFVAAGSRAVLATRRNIPDDATARFIARFHAEGGLDRPGEALRATTAAFHRDGDPIWSAFRLTGNP